MPTAILFAQTRPLLPAPAPAVPARVIPAQVAPASPARSQSFPALPAQVLPTRPPSPPAHTPSPTQAVSILPSRAKTDTVIPDRAPLVTSLDHGSCKGVIFVPGQQSFDDIAVAKDTIRKTPLPAPEPKPHIPFLKVHGNVLYNLNYYSRIDTPYSEKDIYQHTIQTYLDILVKGQYPFRIFLTNHYSNSKLFRNYGDYNLSYNNAAFKQNLRDQLRTSFLKSLPSQKLLDSLQQAMDTKLAKLRSLQGWTKNPALIQHAVEAREKAWNDSLKRQSGWPLAGLSTDSLKNSIPGADELHMMDSLYAWRKREADSLRQEIGKLQQTLGAFSQKSKAEVDQTLKNIQKLDNPAQLQKSLQSMGISDSSLPRGYKMLMAIKSFNIGRTVVNYSELSAKNISVNGVQAEYNPSAYYAFATGSVDYRFRDFIVQSPGQSRQYLNVARIGKTLKDGNTVILTYFTGRRQLYNAATSDTVNVQVPSSSLMGLTLEGNYHLTKNFLVTGEIAKSSSPAYASDSTGKQSGGHLFSMSDHSNEAWSLKLNAAFPLTQTRIKASYKHLANNYQSFSIFTDGSASSAWNVNINQLFWKRQLDLMVGANTNDFSNPLIGKEYKSTTVFKSIQATLRKRNWPVISVGYFPSSQITHTGGHQYIENLFYTMTGNVTHSYSVGGLMMNTAAVYTQFYNKASDSGFTYFNTKNLMLSQTFFLDRLTLTGNASGATNQEYQLYMVEGKGLYTLNKVLSLGGGVKYNKQTNYGIEQMGYSAEAVLTLAAFGQIQFSADKGFVPGMDKRLVPNNTGRLTYFKTF